MRALAAVGFSNLADTQYEVLQLIPKLSERLARSLRSLNHHSLPQGISIYSYFELRPTGRKPVRLRMLSDTKELVIRLDVVAPRVNATPEELLYAFLWVWRVMEEQLMAYLARRRVPLALRDSVRTSMALPVAP